MPGQFSLVAPTRTVVVVDHFLDPGAGGKYLAGQGGWLGDHCHPVPTALTGDRLEILKVPYQIPDAGELMENCGARPRVF